jgi:uncharacterized membrane protein
MKNAYIIHIHQILGICNGTKNVTYWTKHVIRQLIGLSHTYWHSALYTRNIRVCVHMYVMSHHYLNQWLFTKLKWQTSISKINSIGKIYTPILHTCVHVHLTWGSVFDNWLLSTNLYSHTCTCTLLNFPLSLLTHCYPNTCQKNGHHIHVYTGYEVVSLS